MHDNLSSASACHVVCLLLALLVQPSLQQSCGEHTVCRGDRPLLSSGCCPVEAGQTCQPANGENCDEELGYTCVSDRSDTLTDVGGICRGRYNLQVTTRTETEIQLAWSDFAPPDYLYEYVILYRERNNHYDISQWTAMEIGDQPNYTLRRLTPATLYFIKVAVWEDVRSTTLGNISETIMVDTTPVEFCEHRGSHYLVGQPFVHDCEDNCTCLPTGTFQCSPLCPERGVPEVEEGCHLTSGDECCDFRISCPVAGEPCMLDGETYAHGTEFEAGCRMCMCNHGQLECEYPHTCHVMEPTASCPNPRSRDKEGECCPEWHCASTCTYDNRTYGHLEYFTSTHCGLCQCDTVKGVQCAPDCPPVVLVLPDAACPDPHVRQDGCCDTLHCHDPSLDITQFVRRMFALSYSPVSLTLSFEVDPQSEVNGVPLYCEYEILYANTSDPNATWHRRLVQPVDVRLHNDQYNYVEPTAALTRDNAIIVGDRAYVTLSGMYPNTTYYVKIIPLDDSRQDMAESDSGQFNYSDTRSSAMVVVKTLPLNNVTSCFHNGKEIAHGEPITSECNQVCTCLMGKITCQRACEVEQFVLATSPSCPQPRLERQQGDCCPQWKCYPSVHGCLHNGLVMESGQSLYEACQVCTCINATVQCRSVCPPVGSPPRPSCQLFNLSGQCCPQWKCPLESHFPHGVKSSVLLHFYGTCQEPVSNFTEDLRQQLFHRVTSHMKCSDSHSQMSRFCDGLNVQVICPGSHDNNFKRRRRALASVSGDAQKVSVIVSVYKNFSSDTPDEITIQYVQSAGLRLLSLLNSSLDVTVTSGQTISSLRKAHLEPLSFICDQGFSYEKGSCVLSEIESRVSFRPDLQMWMTHITASSATLQWSPLREPEIKDITRLMVEYRQTGTVQWVVSSRLQPTATSYNLTMLQSEQSFSIRLMALTSWSGKSRWTLGEVQFTTRSLAGASAKMPDLTLREISVSETCAFLYWDPVPDNTVNQVVAVNVVYKRTHQVHYTKKQRVHPPTQTYIQLADLQRDTAYTAEVTMLLSSGTTMTSHPVHFVTKSTRKTSTELLIAVVVSCVVTAVAGVIVVLTCVLWRRSRRKGDNNGFENKIYGIQLENNNEEVHVTPAANPAAN